MNPNESHLNMAANKDDHGWEIGTMKDLLRDDEDTDYLEEYLDLQILNDQSSELNKQESTLPDRNTARRNMANQSRVAVAKGTWGIRETEELIALYEKHKASFTDPCVKNLAIWDKISQSLLSKGYNYTAVQCKGRWNTLWQNYKTTRDHNNTTGNDARTCKYYNEIETVVGRQPNVTPVAACSSHHPEQTRAVSDYSDDEDPVPIPIPTLKRKAASQFRKTEHSNNSRRVDDGLIKAKRVRKVAKKSEVMEYLKERDENIVEIERNKLKLLENSQKESQEHSKKIENILTSLIEVLKNVAQ